MSKPPLGKRIKRTRKRIAGWVGKNAKQTKALAGAYRKQRKNRRGLVNARKALSKRPGDDTAIARERRAVEKLLAANERVDRLTDAIRARRAAIARARKKLTRLEGQRKPKGKVYSRAEWGAARPRGSFARQGAIGTGCQHHDAYPALSPKATVAQEAAHMRRIQAGHFARGFTDIGYTEVSFPSGRTYAGRPPSAVPAGALGHNSGYAHWCLNGNYESDRPTDAALAACHRSRGRLAGGRRLVGHYQLNPTACPGRNLKPHLGEEI